MKLFSLPLFVARKLANKFKSLTLKKKIIVIVLIVIGVLITSSIISGSKKEEYITAKAQIGDVTETVSDAGTISTSGKTEVFSTTNGIIDEIYVKNDDFVTKGEALFSTISSATEQEVQLAYSNYLAAKLAYENTNSTAFSLRSTMYTYWDTFYGLSTGDNYENSDGTPRNQERESAEFQTAQDNWKAAEKKYKDQETAIAQSQAGLNSAWLLYQSTQNSTVKAPIDGTISNLSIASGKSVNIKSATNLQPTLIITNKATTEVEISLTETDISKIKVGQTAVIDVNAAGDKKYKGKVVRVDSVGSTTQGVVRYNAYIEVSNPDSKLRSGMSADVEITTNITRDVITLPNSSIKPYRGGKGVRIIDKKTKELVYIPVTIGLKGKDKTEIIKGIEKDQEVVTALSNQQIKRPGLF